MNETLSSLRGRLDGFLGKYTAVQKRNMVITAVFLSAALAVTVWATTRPHYVTIMAGLDNKSLGQVQTQLQTLKIPNEIDGTSVLVPAADANEARVQLAMAGLPSSGYIGYSQVSSSPIGMTDQMFNLQVLNALQQNLDATIDSMNGVQNAQVYIVQPQQSLFVSDPTTGAKASVFVQVGQGNALSAAQIAGIQTLVAHSVTGMNPSDVAVVDQNGVTLSNSGAASSQVAGAGNELSMRQNLENSLQQTISSELNQIVGYGNAVVAVQYDVSFNQVNSNTTKYLPAAGQSTGLIASQQKTSQTSSTPGNSVAGGLTGQSSSNPGLPTYSGTSSTAGNSTNQTSSSTTNYDNGMETQHVVGDPLQIKGIYVSVLLNSNNKAITPAVQANIRQFVSGVVGRSGSSNNSISVNAVPFQATPVANSTQNARFAVPMWAYGAAALLLVGGGVLLLRRRRTPVDAPIPSAPFGLEIPIDDLELMSPTEDEQMREQLVRLASQKPDDFVNLLRTWLVGE